MSLQSTTRNVRIAHFNGTLNEWNARIVNPSLYHYDNAIVFAKVWESFDTYSMKIFAGVDGKSEKHIFEIPDIEDIREIKAMLKRDDVGAFTSEDMQKAIELYLTKSYDSPDTILNIIKTSITWNIVED